MIASRNPGRGLRNVSFGLYFFHCFLPSSVCILFFFIYFYTQYSFVIFERASLFSVCFTPLRTLGQQRLFGFSILWRLVAGIKLAPPPFLS